jgi:hypothetical protein
LVRFQHASAHDQAYVFLRIIPLFFYSGSLLALYCFFSVQTKVPWARLIIYAFFFGMMVELHLSDDYFVIYVEELGMWFTYFTNMTWMSTLNVLTSLPFLDLFIYLIRRQKLGFVSKRAKFAVSILWIGLICPTTIMLFSYTDPVIFVSLLNLSFVIALNFFGIAFLIDPIAFTLSNTQYYEIIVAAKDEGEIAIAAFGWYRQDNQDIKSQAFSAMNTLLNELTAENPEERNEIQRVDLGRKKLIIERSAHLCCYMTTSADDIALKYGLQTLMKEIEKYLATGKRLQNETLEPSFFKHLLRSSFTFATQKNAIINS